MLASEKKKKSEDPLGLRASYKALENNTSLLFTSHTRSLGERERKGKKEAWIAEIPLGNGEQTHPNQPLLETKTGRTEAAARVVPEQWAARR